MTDNRFVMPDAGSPERIAFPPISRATLPNEARVWSIRHDTVPVVTIVLMVPAGSAHDPASSPGMAGVMADLLDEGTERHDAIGLAEALASIGTELSIDVASDVTTFSLSTLSRFMEPALELLADVILRPRLREDDLARVCELRLNRLRQLRSSASAIADRAFLSAVFGSHPYGHGTLGTSAAVSRLSIDDVRAFHAAAVRPDGATLIVAGDTDHDAVLRAAERQLGSWQPMAERSGTAGWPNVLSPPPPGPSRVLVLDRPGAPQTEVRVGHIGPSRLESDYPTLLTLNALLGGQFSSRINLNLREARGLTYGARTSFDFLVRSGTFSCDTNVQGDATPLVVSEILAEFEAVGGSRPVTPDELERAKSSITRGYVRQFETSTQLALSAARLATFDLPADSFDRLVPEVEAVNPVTITTAARAHVRPNESIVVLVGDA
ncbi:MAG: pitrilysin family protein, partial [Vicinamibacterales bacterium]